MTDIQAILVANNNQVTIAFRDWSESPDENGGVFDLMHESTESLAESLDAMGEGIRIEGELNTEDDGNPRIAILIVEIDEVQHRLAARGFTRWGNYNSDEPQCWAVFGMTEDELQALREVPSPDDEESNNVAAIASTNLAAAKSAILYGEDDNISNSGGAVSAVDASSAVDGGQ